MERQILQIDAADWRFGAPKDEWISALEAGKVLYLPHLSFVLSRDEQRFLNPAIRDPKTRNISLDADARLKGVAGDTATQQAVAAMVGRFRTQAQTLIESLLPGYTGALRLAPTSFRPTQVETRSQSWRADDRRLHVDAFPSRPNYGERILRVFTSIRMAQRGYGASANLSKPSPNVSCRAPSPTHVGKPRRSPRCTLPSRCAVNTIT